MADTKNKNNITDKNKRHPDIFSKKASVLFVCIFAALVIFTVSFVLKGAGTEKKTADTSKITKTPTPAVVPTQAPYMAIVLNVDTDSKSITFHDAEQDTEFDLSYDGASKFYGEYGTQITAGVLEAGDLLCVTVRSYDNTKIDTAKADTDAWEYKRVDDLVINEESKYLTIKKSNYKFSDDVCILSNNKKVTLSDLNTSADKYTIRGKGEYVYEIIVTTGHGTLVLLNHGDYVGGTIMLGQKYMFDVTEEGTYVVREGTYDVLLTYGESNINKTIDITRDDVVYFDIYENF